jgi:hypothetical protein
MEKKYVCRISNLMFCSEETSHGNADCSCENNIVMCLQKAEMVEEVRVDFLDNDQRSRYNG